MPMITTYHTTLYVNVGVWLSNVPKMTQIFGDREGVLER